MKRPFCHRGVSKLTVFVNVIFLAMTVVSCGARNDPLNVSGALWDEIVRYDIGPLDETAESTAVDEPESAADEPDSTFREETISPATSPPETSPPEKPDEVETSKAPETTRQTAPETSPPPVAETSRETSAASADTDREVTTEPERTTVGTSSETTAETPSGGGSSDGHTVYWVKSGKVWHTTKDCPSLSRSKSILSGSVDDAMAAGKERVCKRCGG